MDPLFLNVKTVQTIEPVTYLPHTAYTVYTKSGSKYILASGWTLKDAIRLFSKIHNYRIEDIKVKRPFRQQMIDRFKA